jgi:hypothetical protein
MSGYSCYDNNKNFSLNTGFYMGKIVRTVPCLFLLPLFFASFTGCKEHILISELEEPKEIYIHFQGAFGNDDVQALVDGTIVYENNISTSPVLGMADIVPVTFSRTRQQFSVYVNQTVWGTFHVKPDELDAILVRYNRKSQEITFEKSDGNVGYL